jgi:hypothetical protein
MDARGGAGTMSAKRERDNGPNGENEVGGLKGREESIGDHGRRPINHQSIVDMVKIQKWVAEGTILPR